MEQIDKSPALNAKQINQIEKISGKFLYIARAIDNTMMHALNKIAVATTKSTENTAKAVTQFLNYCATHLEPKIRYQASDMILCIDSDASYLVEPEARSRMGGFHYLGNRDGKLFNGPILVLAKIIRNVMASAAEAEVGGLFMNAQEAVPARTTLIDLGHLKPPSPLKTDNSTADGILNGTVKQKRSKALAMKFYWLKDRAAQGEFRIYWAPGAENLGHYYTKVHAPSHHKKVNPIYLYNKDTSPSTMKGCIEILTALSQSARPMPKDRCKQAASQPNSKAASHIINSNLLGKLPFETVINE